MKKPAFALPARTEAILFTALALLVGIHLCVRAVVVPSTLEEATRFFTMVQVAGMPADHSLSVLWAKTCLLLFGPSLLLQRALSLAAFALFARYAFLLSGLVQDRLLRLCLRAALLLMPFAVELFALAGGQALAMAFLLMGLWHLSCIPELPSSSHVRWATLAFVAVLLSYRAMLPVWAIGELALLWLLWRSSGTDKWRQFGPWSLFGLAPGILLFLGHSHTTADVDVWDGLKQSMQLVFGSNAYWLLWSLMLSLAGMAILGFWRWRSAGFTAQRTVLLASVALLVSWPLPYLFLLDPQDPLHELLPWFPLFLLAWAIALDEALRHAAHRRWLALLLLLPAAHMLQGIHVGTTRSSGDAAVPACMAEAALRMQNESGRGLVIGGRARQEPSWNFGRLFDGEPLSNLQTHPLDYADADLLLLSRWGADGVPEDFAIIEEGPAGLVLLARNSPFLSTPLQDSSFSFPATDKEYQDLPLPPLEQLLGKALTVDLSAVVSAKEQLSNGPFLVMEVNVPGGQPGYYAARTIDLLRGKRGMPIRITHALPVVPADAERVAIYIWNPAQVPLPLEKAHLQIQQRNLPEHQATE